MKRRIILPHKFCRRYTLRVILVDFRVFEPISESPAHSLLATGFTLLIRLLEGTGHLIGKITGFDMRVVLILRAKIL